MPYSWRKPAKAFTLLSFRVLKAGQIQHKESAGLRVVLSYRTWPVTLCLLFCVCLHQDRLFHYVQTPLCLYFQSTPIYLRYIELHLLVIEKFWVQLVFG
jgi:hypothetical protein